MHITGQSPASKHLGSLRKTETQVGRRSRGQKCEKTGCIRPLNRLLFLSEQTPNSLGVSCVSVRSYGGGKEEGQGNRKGCEGSPCPKGADQRKRSCPDVRKRNLGRACFPRRRRECEGQAPSPRFLRQTWLVLRARCRVHRCLGCEEVHTKRSIANNNGRIER